MEQNKNEVKDKLEEMRLQIRSMNISELKIQIDEANERVKDLTQATTKLEEETSSLNGQCDLLAQQLNVCRKNTAYVKDDIIKLRKVVSKLNKRSVETDSKLVSNRQIQASLEAIIEVITPRVTILYFTW